MESRESGFETYHVHSTNYEVKLKNDSDGYQVQNAI